MKDTYIVGGTFWRNHKWSMVRLRVAMLLLIVAGWSFTRLVQLSGWVDPTAARKEDN